MHNELSLHQGYLIPADLERIHQFQAPDQDVFAWSKRNLLASPGALVLRNGQISRIPTLAPARRPDGACIFLNDGSHCAIHAVSPYGCAFFDAHIALTVANRRSKRGLQDVMAAWDAGDLYAQIWLILVCECLTALAPEVARAQLQKALGN